MKELDVTRRGFLGGMAAFFVALGFGQVKAEELSQKLEPQFEKFAHQVSVYINDQPVGTWKEVTIRNEVVAKDTYPWRSYEPTGISEIELSMYHETQASMIDLKRIIEKNVPVVLRIEYPQADTSVVAQVYLLEYQFSWLADSLTELNLKFRSLLNGVTSEPRGRVWR